MMGFDFYFRHKIPVAILGAIGAVSQKLIHLLSHHPWFHIVALCDHEPFIGQTYQAAQGSFNYSFPDYLKQLIIQPCKPSPLYSLVFSTFQTFNAQEMERAFMQAGLQIISCFAHHPLEPNVYLMVTGVNSDQLINLKRSELVASPHSIANALTLCLKPLLDRFEIQEVQATFSHSFSDGNDSVSPLVSKDNNRQIEQEIIHILGQTEANAFSLSVSLQYEDQLPAEWMNGWISMKFKQGVEKSAILQAWQHFTIGEQHFRVPLATKQPLQYDENLRNQKREGDMTLSLMQLSPCSDFDYKFFITFPHLMRIAGSALLNAELLVVHGKIYW